MACNDDITPGIVVQSQLLNVPLTVGTTYYIMISSFGPPDPNPVALGGASWLHFLYNNGANPTPSITSLSPTNVNSGAASLTLTVNGTGFLNGASVLFTSSELITPTPQPTNFVSSTQLTANIPASAIALPGPASVFVENPQPNIGASNTLPFTINVGTYPVPTINSLSPTSVIAGSLPFAIDVGGTNFASTAVLNFNGVPVPTTVNSSLFLFGVVPTSSIASAGTFQVTVSNPSPGGGPSNSLPFTITAPSSVPTISSLSPGSGPNDPTSFVLTVNGTNFQQGATVVWNLTNFLSTNFVSATQLTANVPGYLVAAAGSFPVNVVDPAPAGTSSAVNFTVTGPPPDFTLNYAGSNSETVTAGQTATFLNAVYVFALYGFTGTVNLSCSLSAPGTQCSVSPLSVPPQQAATITVTTMARGLAPPSLPVVRFYRWPQFVPPLLLTMLLVISISRFARTRRHRLAGALTLAALVLFLGLQAMGCGGGGGGSGPPSTGTPAGPYTVTVTGTSGSTAHTTTLTLTVN